MGTTEAPGRYVFTQMSDLFISSHQIVVERTGQGCLLTDWNPGFSPIKGLDWFRELLCSEDPPRLLKINLQAATMTGFCLKREQRNAFLEPTTRPVIGVHFALGVRYQCNPRGWPSGPGSAGLLQPAPGTGTRWSWRRSTVSLSSAHTNELGCRPQLLRGTLSCKQINALLKDFYNLAIN